MTPTREELDALHGRMTKGTWGLQAFYENSGTPDERTFGMIVDADSDFCIGIVDEREAGVDCLSDDLAGIVALKNAWPAVSAKLAAKDAEIARLTAELHVAREMARQAELHRTGVASQIWPTALTKGTDHD